MQQYNYTSEKEKRVKIQPSVSFSSSICSLWSSVSARASNLEASSSLCWWKATIPCSKCNFTNKACSSPDDPCNNRKKESVYQWHHKHSMSTSVLWISGIYPTTNSFLGQKKKAMAFHGHDTNEFTLYKMEACTYVWTSRCKQHFTMEILL